MSEDEPATSAIPVPEEFFREILPRVTDLAELKIILHVFHRANGRGTHGVPLQELLSSDVLRSVVGLLSPEPAEDRLRGTLDRAVANGSLLRVTVRIEGRAVPYFLPATHHTRRLVDRLLQDDVEPLRELDLLPAQEAVVYRPNIFAFYEQHIGPLTPLVAEQLRDAERSYPRSWIEEAIRAAVLYEKRSWRYVQTILTRWEQTGGPARASRKSS
jgi:DnaD/phage-associated family protein